MDKTNIGKTIKDLRLSFNLSRKELAEKINYSKTIINYWENNEKMPNVQAIIALADFFNVTTDYLTGRELEDGRVIIQETELPNDENNLLTNYRKLSSDLKESAQEYLKSLNNINNKHNIK